MQIRMFVNPFESTRYFTHMFKIRKIGNVPKHKGHKMTYEYYIADFGGHLENRQPYLTNVLHKKYLCASKCVVCTLKHTLGSLWGIVMVYFLPQASFSGHMPVLGSPF